MAPWSVVEPSPQFKALPTSETSAPARTATRDPQNSCLALVAFAAFGSGSGWIVLGALFTEIPIYQRQFGLVTSNRMAIGYNLGIASVVFFGGVRALLRCTGRDMNSSAVILVIAVGNMLTLLLAAAGVRSLNTLVALTFLGGSCGYLSGVVHQGHLLCHYHNRLVASFWTGDSLAAVMAAAMAVLQRPYLEADAGRRFGAHVVFLCLLPVVFLAQCVFLCIERHGLGALGAIEAEDSADCRVDTVESAALIASGKSASVAMVPQWKQCFPAGAVDRPTLTVLLCFLNFFLALTCWGIGDSVIPYCCAMGSEVDDGSMCVFRSNLGTTFAMLLGTSLATLPRQVSIHPLLPCAVTYTITFTLLCAAATWGGHWARPRFASGNSEGNYIVLLVVVMRAKWVFLIGFVTRLTQVEYLPGHANDMNALIYGFRVVANLVGIAISTAVIETLAAA